MNYVQQVKDALTLRLPDCDSNLLDFYTLIVLLQGSKASLKGIHEAWSVWTNGPRGRSDHQSLVPFEDLTVQVQELDRKYADACVEVANIFGYHGI